MMNKLLLIFIFLLTTLLVQAADVKIDTKNLPAEAVAEAKQRAEKVMQQLSLSNDSIRENVSLIVTNRYLEIREIHQRYDIRNNAIEATTLDRSAKDEELERSYYQYNSDLYRSRFGYVAWLSFYLNEEQVTKVKDAMTYGMFHVRYNDFLDLLPNMAESDKNRVWHWLVEAREFSMDFETPRKMRQMFTKYRGRINNYLSSRGHDLRKATEAQKNRQLNK